jgi:glycosyltransferase involved in cell wall biosynthesis
MRIVIVTEQYSPMLGGVATVTQNLSQDLAEAGHQVWVVAPSPGHYNERTEHGLVQVYRFASFEWPSYDGQRIAFPPVTPLSRLFRRIRPDVIHIHSPIVLGNLAQLLAAALHLTVVGTNHYMPINMAPSLTNEALIGRRFEALSYSYLVSFYNRCDFVTAPTATALAMLKEHGLKAPSQPVSNGIDLERFTVRPRDEALRRRLGLPADRPIILYVGRLSYEKRVNVLLDAMVQLRQPAHLAIAGTGPAREDLDEQVSALGIGRRVTFLGRVSDEELVPLYRLGDVFAMPSVAELQCVAALEALAVGLPVVASDAGALPELVRDGHNGFLFAPDDSAALAERLAHLVANPALHQQMRSTCRATAESHDRRLVVEEWQRLYALTAARVREAGRAHRRPLSRDRIVRGKSARVSRSPITREKPLVVGRASGGERRAGGRRRAQAATSHG